jgi:acyl dehydratase
MSLAITTIDELRSCVGEELGVSDYQHTTQERVDEFAELTDDRQWIHTDPERAAQTPYGGTIGHGYYTLALAPKLLHEVLPLDAFSLGVNYGLDNVRFPTPLPVGARVRMRVGLIYLLFQNAGGTCPCLPSRARSCRPRFFW